MPTREEVLLEAKKRGLLNGDASPTEPQSESREKRLGLFAPVSLDVPPKVPVNGEFAPPTPRPSPPVTPSEALQPGYVMAGAMGGMEMGAPLGPAGMLAGAALGAAGGSAASDLKDALMRIAGHSEIPDRSVEDITRRAAKEGLTEGAFTGGVTAGVEGLKGAAKFIGRKALGITPQSVDLLNEAKRLGVDFGTVDVSQYPVIQGYGKIIGAFPFVGSPFKAAKEAQSRQLQGSFGRLMERFGPTVTFAQAGRGLKTLGEKKFASFRKEADDLYTNFRTLAEESDAQIPTEKIKEAATRYIDDIIKNRPRTVGNEIIERPVADPGLNYAEKLRELPDSLNVRQFDNVTGDLDDLMAKAKQDGFKVTHLMDIKKGAEVDLRNLKGDSAVRDALDKADDYYANTVKMFETPTGQQFGRVDKNIFKLGYEAPGNLNPDEMMRVVFNTRSPQAMADLRKIVGTKGMKMATGTYVRNAWRDAITNPEGKRMFDAAKFRRNLGLEDESSSEFLALKEALKGTGMNVDDFKRLADVADRAFAHGMGDPSQFVARRAILGGAKSAAAAAVPGLGAAAVGGLDAGLSTLVGVLAARQGSKILSSPVTVRLLTTAMNPRLPTAQRNAAMVRIMRMADVKPEDAEE